MTDQIRILSGEVFCYQKGKKDKLKEVHSETTPFYVYLFSFRLCFHAHAEIEFIYN